MRMMVIFLVMSRYISGTLVTREHGPDQVFTVNEAFKCDATQMDEDQEQRQGSESFVQVFRNDLDGFT